MNKVGNESEIRDKEAERFKLALWATNSAIWDWDLEQNTLWDSPGNQSLFHRDKNETSQNFRIDDPDNFWTSRLHPEDRDRTMRCLFDHLENDTPYDVEYRSRQPSGDYLWIRSVGRALRNSDGKPFRMVGSDSDISERKAKESELHESEERFKRIYSGGSLGVSIVGLDSRFLSVNQELCRMLGYDESELVGRNFKEITFPDDIDLDSEFAARLFAGEMPSYQIEKRFLSKTGDIVWVQMTGALINNEQGEPLYGMAMFQNITGQKTSAERLRQSEAQFKSLFENAIIGVTITNTTGHYVATNAAYQRMLGFSAEDLQGMRWQDVSHPEEIARIQSNTDDMHASQSSGITYEKRFIHKNGETICEVVPLCWTGWQRS